MSINEKWSYNSSDDGWWGNETFDNKEDAIEQGKEECGENFYIGQCRIVTIDDITGIDAEDILYKTAENAYDEYGEFTEDYLTDVNKEHQEILEERLKAVFKDWAKEFKYEPNFYTIINLEQIQNESE